MARRMARIRIRHSIPALLDIARAAKRYRDANSFLKTQRYNDRVYCEKLQEQGDGLRDLKSALAELEAL